MKSAALTVFCLCTEMTGTHSIQVAFDLLYSTSEEQEDGSLGEIPPTVSLGNISNCAGI